MIILVEKFALFKKKEVILNEIFCSGEKILSKFAKLLKYERVFFSHFVTHFSLYECPNLMLKFIHEGKNKAV